MVEHHRCQFVDGQLEACQDVTAPLEHADRLEGYGLPDAARNLRRKAAEQAGRCLEVEEGWRSGWGLAR